MADEQPAIEAGQVWRLRNDVDGDADVLVAKMASHDAWIDHRQQQWHYTAELRDGSRYELIEADYELFDDWW
jgi:hypothetical protein